MARMQALQEMQRKQQEEMMQAGRTEREKNGISENKDYQIKMKA